MLNEFQDDRFPGLLYHRFVRSQAELARYPGTENIFTITEGKFEAQMAALAQAGYHGVGPDEVLSFLTQGVALPSRPVLITVDDGWRSNIDIMLPILERHGFACTIFVTTGPQAWIFRKFQGLDRGLTADDVRELRRRGVHIGAHTVTHPYLIELDDEAIRWEFTESKRTLEEWTGEPCRFLSIPGNFYNRHIAQLARDCGYEAVFTANVGTISRASDLFDVNRLIVEGAFTLDEFRANLRPPAILTRKVIAWVKKQPPRVMGASRYMAMREVLFNSPLRHLFTMRRLKAIAAGAICSLFLLVVYWIWILA
jgi:peptidoglycan/xylan/chitin deacetylase (PgdA/CDA1 family)